MRLEGKKVLIADDEERLTELMVTFLTSQGAEVRAANDGAEAFREATMWQPDVILMDLNMPGVNGIEAIRSLRMTLPDMPILVLTGYTTEENFEAARKAGASECMGKPPGLEDLVESLVALTSS